MKPGGNLKDLLSAGEEEIRELFILTEDKMEEKGGRTTMKNTNSRGKTCGYTLKNSLQIDIQAWKHTIRYFLVHKVLKGLVRIRCLKGCA